MVKFTIYNLTPETYSTFELIKIMTINCSSDDYYFILYTKQIGHLHKTRKYHITADSEVIFQDNILDIIVPNKYSIMIDLSEEKAYKIETKKIGE